MDTQAMWEKAAAFHGHICGGLTIGYKAALYAMELLDITFSKDEAIVCVAENDACGVDAIQAILGCSVGKGNLLFRLRGKQAFTFFNRKNGKSARLVLRDFPGLSREQKQKFFFETDHKALFDVKSIAFTIPEKARLFQSFPCEKCGEMTAEPYLRLQNGQRLCLDCFDSYNRFSL